MVFFLRYELKIFNNKKKKEKEKEKAASIFTTINGDKERHKQTTEINDMEQVTENIKKCIADRESTLANLELINTVDDQAVLEDFALKEGAEVVVEALAKHSRDPKVLGCGFTLLSKLALLPEAGKHVGKKAVVLAALNGIQKCQGDPEAQLKALNLLCVTAKFIGEELWDEVGKHAAAVIGAVDESKGDPKVQRLGLQLLSLLYLNTHGSDTDPRGEGIRVAVDAVKRFPDDAAIQRYGLGVMGLIQLGNSEQQERVAEFGGVEAAIAAMRKWGEDPVIQGWGCYALGSAGFGNKKLQSRAQKLGGVACVVDALRKFGGDENVQEWGIRTLAFLAHDNLDVQIELYANGIEASLEAMKAHPALAGVQQWGANLVSCLASSDQTLFRDKIVALGGVDVVLSGIRQLRDEEKVQASGIQALGLLGSRRCEEVQKQVVFKEKGFDDIVYAMISYETNRDVLAACCYAIKELTAGNAEAQEEFGNTFSGVESVLSAIVSHEDCVGLQREAWGVIANISENAGCLGKFLMYEGIETTHKFMKMYCTDESIQRSCLSILLNIGTLALKEN